MKPEGSKTKERMLRRVVVKMEVVKKKGEDSGLDELKTRSWRMKYSLSGAWVETKAQSDDLRRYSHRQKT